jgi:hypothetical protein
VQTIWKKLCILIALSLVTAGVVLHLPVSVAEGAAPSTSKVKRAKWTQPAKRQKTGSKAKKNTNKKSKSNAKKSTKPGTAGRKPTSAKVPPPAATTKGKKAPAKKLVESPVKSKTTPVSPKKKTPPTEMTLPTSITDDDIDNIEERGTSPWLYVFIAFVLACVGGMLFINSRRRQLEAARVNFRDHTSNHEVAFNSKNSDLDMPAASGHEAPTTSTLFARTNDIRQGGREPRSSLFGKLSDKASGLLKSSGKSRTKTRDAIRSDQRSMADTAANFAKYEDEDTSFASITTISAVRSSAGRADTRTPVQDTVSGTAEPMVVNAQGEPCSFERYVEIQVATQCWRAKEIPINQKLQENFGINTEELIQYEFYWKQKISGNINLRKKFEELEPLYSAKYEAA